MSFSAATPSAEYLRDRETELHASRGEHVAPVQHLFPSVSLGTGTSVDRYRAGLDADEPRSGMLARPHRGTFSRRSQRRDEWAIDDEEDVAGFRMTIGVEALSAPRHDEIGLRFGVAVQSNRLLNADVRPAGQARQEQLGQTTHDPGMGWTNRRHGEDLSIEQIHPVGEDPGFAHA